MDTFSPSARPPNCAIAWATGKELYIEIPCKDGPPYIIREKRSIEGLARGLNVLVEHCDFTTQTGVLNVGHPAVKKSAPSKATVGVSETSRARAGDLVRRLLEGGSDD